MSISHWIILMGPVNARDWSIRCVCGWVDILAGRDAAKSKWHDHAKGDLK